MGKKEMSIILLQMTKNGHVNKGVSGMNIGGALLACASYGQNFFKFHGGFHKYIFNTSRWHPKKGLAPSLDKFWIHLFHLKWKFGITLEMGCCLHKDNTYVWIIILFINYNSQWLLFELCYQLQLIFTYLQQCYFTICKRLKYYYY